MSEPARPYRTRESAAELGEHLRLVFDDIVEGVQIIDFEGRYIYLNAAAARHGRRAAAELVGRKMTSEYPGIEKTEMFGLLQRCMSKGTPQRMVNLFTYPDGSTAWFELRMNPVSMGVLILSLDITSRKATEEQVRKSQEELAITLDCLADGVMTTDVAGCITRMNPAAEGLTGWSEVEATGRPLDELVSFINQRSEEPVHGLVDQVLRDGVKIGLANDTLLIARDGTRVPIASSGAPLRDADGVTRGAVLLFKDMTEQYELLSMLQQSQKMEAIGRLAGGVAHDFNNLLTVISGYCDVVLHGLDDREDLRADLTEISKAAERATALTRQLLAFSRRQDLKAVALDLNQVVTNVQKMLARIIGEEIQLVTRLGPDLPAVQFDPGQIEQVIVNLVVNARDAMPYGGTLVIETMTVDPVESARMAPGSAAHYVALRVSDTGIGMDEETKAKIFEPFFTTKPPGQGTGLGLATMYGIVEQSGGTIAFQSELGKGTTFTVQLPRASATQ